MKLFATDMDGTLLSLDGRTISQENLDAISKLKEKGIKIVIATGRVYFYTIEQAKITDADYIIYGNGVGIHDFQNDKEIELGDTQIESKKAIKIWDFIKQFPNYSQLQCNGDIYMSKDANHFFEERYNRKMPEDTKDKVHFVDDLTDVISNNDIQKLNSCFENDDHKKLVIKEYENDSELFLSSSLANNIEINNAIANKGAALESLAKYLNISQNEIMAIGDNSNDSSMLEYAGISYAMANSVPKLFDIAKYKTLSNAKSGVAKAIFEQI